MEAEEDYNVAKTAIVFGVLLMFLGAGFYFVTAPHAPTALIPVYFGLVLAVLGGLAHTEDAARRMLFMHIAVTVGLLGFLFPFVRAIVPAVRLVKGVSVTRPLAVEEQMLMALLCLLFTGLCVRSFIAARRSRI